MRKAPIPADGQWHCLPHPKVVAIEAPPFFGSAEVQVDITPAGVGRVRIAPVEDTPSYTVRYKCRGDFPY